MMVPFVLCYDSVSGRLLSLDMDARLCHVIPLSAML